MESHLNGRTDGRTDRQKADADGRRATLKLDLKGVGGGGRSATCWKTPADSVSMKIFVVVRFLALIC